MDKKSKIFFAAFFVLIVASIAATYYRYMVLRDYIVEAEADCDPYAEQCFIYVCDPEAGEECTGDPTEDTSYYKFIHRNAKNIPLCDPAAEECDALMCPEGEAECSFTLCDPATAEADGVTCNDPAAYTLENPVTEDDATGEDATGDETAGDEGAADAAADDQSGATQDGTDTGSVDNGREAVPQDQTP